MSKENATSPRDLVQREVFHLQELARSALPPAFTGDKRLPGKSVPAEEDALRKMWIGVSDTLEDLERNIIPRLTDPAERDHLYRLLFYFITAARLIGSRAQVSQRQKNFFKYQRAEASARKGLQARARETAIWQDFVTAHARELREQDPHISKEQLATDILDAWPSEIKRKHQHRTVVDFLATLEKRGLLPEKIKRAKE